MLKKITNILIKLSIVYLIWHLVSFVCTMWGHACNSVMQASNRVAGATKLDERIIFIQ